MISNIHFEKTKGFGGKINSGCKGDSIITQNLKLRFGLCAGLRFENKNYTCIR